MNWGTKLIIGMLLFMSFIIVLAVRMIRSDPDALVENNYYEKGLNYDEVYQHKAQVFKDSAVPTVVVLKNKMVISFRARSQGSIRLMRTSDQRMDRNIEFNTNETHQFMIATRTLTKGQWRLIVDWNNEKDTRYLYEREIILP